MVLQGAGLVLGIGKGRTSRSRDFGDGAPGAPTGISACPGGLQAWGKVVVGRYVLVGSPNPRKP